MNWHKHQLDPTHESSNHDLDQDWEDNSRKRREIFSNRAKLLAARRTLKDQSFYSSPQVNTSGLKTVPCILFNLRGELFALELRDLQAVIRSTAIRAVPGAAPLYHGLFCFRGVVTPLLAIERLLGLEGAEASSRPNDSGASAKQGAKTGALNWIIVLRSKQFKVAFGVEEILQQSSIQIQEQPNSETEPAKKPFSNFSRATTKDHIILLETNAFFTHPLIQGSKL